MSPQVFYMTISAGSRLGPYEILSSVGSGGMGEVYRANDPRLEREVAVKILHQDGTTNEDALSRFRAEAKAVAALSHPNILAAYDVGFEHGVAFVVTELLEGETLRIRVSRSPLPWRKAVDFAAAIADGLAAAHEKSIVHRDIKPENIFITNEGRVKILDFGLAYSSGGVAREEASRATDRLGSSRDIIVGTIGYMSPEQLRGESVDARSDIFSLGCLLYEMVTGRVAFARKSHVEMMAAVLKEEPDDPIETGTKIPLELSRIISRCLEKNRNERFQSARDLAFALRAVSGSSGTHPMPLSLARPSRAWAAVLIVAVVALGAVLYFGRGSFGSRGVTASAERKSVDSLAVLPFANLSRDPGSDYLSDGITESLINSLSQLPNLRVMSRSSVFQFKGKEINPEQIGRKFGVRAILTGTLKDVGEELLVSAELIDTTDSTQIWGGQYKARRTDILTMQSTLAREISEKLRVKLSEADQKRLQKKYTVNSEAYHDYLRGRYHWNKRSKEGLARGIEYFQAAIEKDPAYALAYVGLADSYALVSGYASVKPSDAFPRAKAAALKALEIDESLAEAHASLGIILDTYEWDWTGAETELLRAIELKPGYATAHHWYGLHLGQRGRFPEAIASMQRAVKLDPLSLVINRNLGRVLYFSRQYDLAIQNLRRTLEMDPRFGPALHDLGHAYIEKKMFPEAIETFTEARRITGDSEDLAGIAHAQARAGHAAEAEKMLLSLNEINERQYVTPYEMSMVYAALGRKSEALDWLERSCDDRYPQSAWIKVEPAFDSLRDEPRFKELVRRMHPE